LGFLNQKPVKGMFVNEVEKPNIYDHWEISIPRIQGDMSQNRDCMEWREAEKKVIFKGFDYLHKDDYSSNYEDDNENYVQIYHNGTVTLTNEDSTLFQINTLHDLAQATNGELELQNVTL
jgi:hypothetical protein